MPEPISIVAPLPPRNSTCGYCGGPGERSTEESSYHKAECIGEQLSCRVYQEMIDRGWRRSGTYCYKPDLKRSCCPQYTIKLDALAFKPSKSQRKLLNRWNRFVIHGDKRDNDDPMEGGSKDSKPAKEKTTHVFNLTEDIHASEHAFLKGQTSAHKFEVTLEPASLTEEKFALYNSYQKEIHHEAKDKAPSGFARFLVHNPLVPQAIEYPSERPDHLPEKYGAYHQLYRLDGKLIGMGVIDILPNCVSSVYFMYDKEWEKYSLGKLSALREAALAREMHEAGVTEMKYLYMGFYIQSCAKMRYKGDYSPSYLADPEDYTWHPLETCRPLLEKYHYACFTHPEHSSETPATSADPTPSLPPETLQSAHYIVKIEQSRVVVAPIITSQDWNRRHTRDMILITLDALGEKLSGEVIFDLQPDF